MLILTLPILTQTIWLTDTTPTIPTSFLKPNFLSKTIVATLFIGAFFIILLLNPNILHFAFNPKRSILSRYKPS